MLGNKGQGDPEVGAFIAAVILGAALSLVIPPSRYEQPVSSPARRTRSSP